MTEDQRSEGLARRSVEAVGDDRVETATGRGRDAWFGLLDEASATHWSHKDIAAWLTGEHGVDGWWAQSITVAYEQERGMRQPGQRSDGSFEVSPSKTLACSLETAFALVSEADCRDRWLDGALRTVGAGDSSEVLGATPTSSVRLAWPAGALGAPEDKPGRVVVGLYQPTDVVGNPRGKVRVAVQHGGLATPELAEKLKTFWKARLDDLARLADEEAAEEPASGR
ncbi:DUF4287 domain-containing protein [Isoptericola variabilis]|uniref:DUF4287 domain-containing protein n=1 Tax=Isoptericola variabilis (strain 225) TaxID=743718 RepID=F6FQS3_ISOV2|nr:DUF4287 domain-containing protein [Isoptericola variabilis]AEG42888.1 hypothetical protein Isova_0072 [Isoptericola variabilis 225]TWH30193.1 uncharacterized protein DUF4287 [Isoptericola variabilis J7]